METMSKRWAITNCTSGTELGIYAGETREEAIDALDLDAGYTRGDIPEIDAERDAGSPDLIVREVDALAVALHSAVMMERDDQARRMSRLRRAVGRWDVHSWARHNIEAIEG